MSLTNIRLIEAGVAVAYLFVCVPALRVAGYDRTRVQSSVLTVTVICVERVSRLAAALPRLLSLVHGDVFLRIRIFKPSCTLRLTQVRRYGPD
jgi:hypothetical protein